jgi:hypothetical protein
MSAPDETLPDLTPGPPPPPSRFKRLKGWAWRHRKVLLILTGIFTLAGSFAGWRTYDYIQNDPTFCTSCHLMDGAYDRWANSPHAQVNCHTCHPGSLASNLHQLWVTITDKPKEVKKHAVVPPEICAQCHINGEEADKWPQIAGTSGHRVHWLEKGIQCVACHAPAVHEFIPTDKMCAKCHPTETVGLSAMAQVHCTKCHDFLAEFSETLLAGDARCAECHDDGIGGPKAAVWHKDVNCYGCHPVHDGATATLAADPVGGPVRGERAVPCADCHVDEGALVMPEAHECVACHQPHAVPPGEQACRECHTEPAAKMPEREHHACIDCHLPHQPNEPPSDRCADCHGDDQAAVTPIEAHRDCDACHQVHEPGPPDGPACAVCHKVEARKVAAGPAGHRSCDGCHAVHEPQDVEKCGDCHQAERALANQAPGPHQKCANCHDTHGPARSGTDVCGTCHQQEAAAARAQNPDHGRCADCHSPHRPEIPAISRCGDCHEDQAGLVAAEPTIRGPGRLAKPEPGEKNQDFRALGEVPEGRGSPLPSAHSASDRKHQDCRTCHPWHQKKIEATGATCVGCHQEMKPAKGTGESHADCASCHPAHRSGSPAPCAACHVREAPRAGQRKEHSDCAGCHGATHRLADVDRATCGTCHEMTGAGLHASAGHDRCLDCHGVHPVNVGGADRCARCHPSDAIENHPAAARGVKVCQGCHAFRKGE